MGRADLERKFSADERELYMNTVSEETKIEKQKHNKMRKIHFFSGFPTLILTKYVLNTKVRRKNSPHFLFFGYA